MGKIYKSILKLSGMNLFKIFWSRKEQFLWKRSRWRGSVYVLKGARGSWVEREKKHWVFFFHFLFWFVLFCFFLFFYFCFFFACFGLCVDFHILLICFTRLQFRIERDLACYLLAKSSFWPIYPRKWQNSKYNQTPLKRIQELQKEKRKFWSFHVIYF